MISGMYGYSTNVLVHEDRGRMSKGSQQKRMPVLAIVNSKLIGSMRFIFLAQVRVGVRPKTCLQYSRHRLWGAHCRCNCPDN